MTDKEIVFEYLKKNYKDVSIEHIQEFSINMFSYVDKKGHKHIIRVLASKPCVTDVKTVKFKDHYLEIVTRKDTNGNTSNSNSKSKRN